VDADTPTLITYGIQEGTAVGYVPKRRHGQASYAPIISRLGAFSYPDAKDTESKCETKRCDLPPVAALLTKEGPNLPLFRARNLSWPCVQTGTELG
jgi:hypothetical protein